MSKFYIYSEPTLCRRCGAWFYKIPASECDCKEVEEQ